MKKTLKSLFETGVLHLLVLCLIFALALVVSGCSVTKVNYEKDEKGVVSYRLYRNDHWLKTSGTGISGGMTKDGKFEFAAEGLERSPSEEFNRTMMTYTSAFIQLAQIAAAAYNPSASAAAREPLKVESGNVESSNLQPSNLQPSTQSEARPSQIILEVPKTESQPELIMLTSAQDSTEKSATSDPHSAECADGSCTTGACTDGSCEVK